MFMIEERIGAEFDNRFAEYNPIYVFRAAQNYFHSRSGSYMRMDSLNDVEAHDLFYTMMGL